MLNRKEVEEVARDGSPFERKMARTCLLLFDIAEAAEGYFDDIHPLQKLYDMVEKARKEGVL